MIDEKKLIEIGDWIPCSERLPKVPDYIDDDDCPEFIVTLAPIVTILKCSSDGSWFDDFGERYKVIAWQYLPKPWEGEEGCAENK